MKHFVCFHLFNDYSGSPKVLQMVLEGLLVRGHKVDLVTSQGGVLDELRGIDNCRLHHYAYRFSRNPAVTMMRYACVQLLTFCCAFRWMFSRNTVFYINTLLPIGPALAGRLMGKRVVYHYHENAFVKGTFYKVLATMMEKLAHKIICVSEYQASFLHRKEKVTVVPNALPKSFVEKLRPDKETAFNRRTVLMLGSLKLYKSPLEFVELASKLPEFSFVLVINDRQENIDSFMEKHSVAIPSNLTIYPCQSDVVSFYHSASVVLNLSNKKSFLETFGLTALEAMTVGLPVIVPTEGGIAEMVEDGVNGYKIDVDQMEELVARIKEMLFDKQEYLRLADNAQREAKLYDEERMITRIEELVIYI